MKRYCLLLLVTILVSGIACPAVAQQDTTRQITEVSQKKPQIKLVENSISIEDLPNDGLLEIYNIMGVRVYNRRIKAGTHTFTLNLPKGYYIIKIGKITKKVAIR